MRKNRQKIFLVYWCLWICACWQLQAQPTGARIQITVHPYRNCWIYIGNYYGKSSFLTDSVWLNEQGTGILEKQTKYPEGIYFLLSPNRVKLLEFLMDSRQRFTVEADTARPNEGTFSGSRENAYYLAYTRFVRKQCAGLPDLEKQYRQAISLDDSLKIQKSITATLAGLNTYRSRFVQQHPTALLSVYFQAMQRPQLPKAKDGHASYYYSKDHFWDGVDFKDSRLLRTPFFEPKIEEYIKNYVSPDPDSIIPAIHYLLLLSRENPEMHQYLLGKFTDKYINPEIMGQDKVFLFLFNNYFSKGDTSWLSSPQVRFIFNRAYNLMANQIGEPAPPLALKDTTGTLQNIYKLEADYTLLLFWDPECPHCKTVVPQLDSIYNAKWKTLGVKIYAVNTAGTALQKWKAYIVQNHLSEWINVMETEQDRKNPGYTDYRQLYDVIQTPTLYLLDRYKKIIAKKLTVLQLNSLLDARREPLP